MRLVLERISPLETLKVRRLFKVLGSNLMMIYRKKLLHLFG